MLNKEWSEANKLIQLQLKKEATFTQGISTLLELRETLFNELLRLKKTLTKEEFTSIPFINAEGYHNKTIAYSIWHIYRIEDIVAHTLIAQDEQIFFLGNYQNLMEAPIITTGNELRKQQIADFSNALNIDELYEYAKAVKEKTDNLLKKLTFVDSKRKVSEKDKASLKALEVVSEDKHAYWLIDYWCNKDIKGLIQMPFSRHWIMHVAACIRIEEKLHKIR